MILVDVAIKSKIWNQEISIEKFIVKTCKKLILLTELRKFIQKKITLEVAISLVSNRQMQKINFQFRGKSSATNVLSFPIFDEKLIRKVGLQKVVKACGTVFLGDIVIAYEKLKKESLVQKKQFHDHLTHLILHSILHLIGFDHKNKKMAKIMENLEIKILKELKISNPYLTK